VISLLLIGMFPESSNKLFDQKVAARVPTELFLALLQVTIQWGEYRVVPQILTFVSMATITSQRMTTIWVGFGRYCDEYKWNESKQQEIISFD